MSQKAFTRIANKMSAQKIFVIDGKNQKKHFMVIDLEDGQCPRGVLDGAAVFQSEGCVF